jgi:serine/threonine protein kinase
MYRLLSGGDHPLYKKGETEKEYYEQLMNFPSYNNYNWKFPSNFSELAKSFFKKLCIYPPSERYDAKQALQHPWITRNIKAEIPLTQKELYSRYEIEANLRKAARLAFFVSVTSNKLVNSSQ